MTLDEAIKRLSGEQSLINRDLDPGYWTALQLGIEALKAVKECRASHMFCPGVIMPGETEE